MDRNIKTPKVNLNPDLHLSDSNALIKANRFIEKVRELRPKIENLSLPESSATGSLQDRFRDFENLYPELVGVLYDDGNQMNVALLGVTPEEFKHQRLILGLFDITKSKIKPLGHSVEITAHVIARMLQRYPTNSEISLQNIRFLLQMIYVQSLQHAEPEKLRMGEKLPCFDKNGIQHTFVISSNVTHPGEKTPTARFSILTYYI